MTPFILKIFILQFTIGLLIALWKKDLPMALYFGGAAILNVGVLIK